MGLKEQKPNGVQAGWKFLGTETRFESGVFRLREDSVELDGGKQIDYAYLERAPAVIVVPITTAGEMVLIKQYRYAVDEWCLEVPAGGTHDSGGASLEEVATKELREEAGASARSLTYVECFYAAASLSDEKSHVFLAEGVELSKELWTEASETIKVQRVPVAQAIKMARDGAIKTGPCALAILLCESRLSSYLPESPDSLATAVADGRDSGSGV